MLKIDNKLDKIILLWHSYEVYNAHVTVGQKL